MRACKTLQHSWLKCVTKLNLNFEIFSPAHSQWVVKSSRKIFSFLVETDFQITNFIKNFITRRDFTLEKLHVEWKSWSEKRNVKQSKKERTFRTTFTIFRRKTFKAKSGSSIQAQTKLKSNPNRMYKKTCSWTSLKRETQRKTCKTNTQLTMLLALAWDGLIVEQNYCFCGDFEGCKWKDFLIKLLAQSWRCRRKVYDWIWQREWKNLDNLKYKLERNLMLLNREVSRWRQEWSWIGDEKILEKKLKLTWLTLWLAHRLEVMWLGSRSSPARKRDWWISCGAFLKTPRQLE